MVTRFQELLWQYAERRGLGRNELARAAKVSPSYITRLETGERRPPQPPILRRLATALRLSSDERELFYVTAGYAGPVVSRLVHEHPPSTWVAVLATRQAAQEEAVCS